MSRGRIRGGFGDQHLGVLDSFEYSGEEFNRHVAAYRCRLEDPWPLTIRLCAVRLCSLAHIGRRRSPTPPRPAPASVAELSHTGIGALTTASPFIRSNVIRLF